MKKFVLLISFVMVGFVFVGCDVSSKNMPKTKEIVVDVCGKKGIIYSQMQKEVAKEVCDIIVCFNETITEEEHTKKIAKRKLKVVTVEQLDVL